MKRILTVVVLVLTVAWVGFIFSNSLKTGVESDNASSTVHTVVNEVAQSLGAKQEISHKTIRTSAHFTEFAVLSALLCLDIMLLVSLSPADALSREHTYLLLSLPASVLIAGIDELLQFFTPGRAMQLIDVLVDACGALCGMLVFLAVFAIAHATKRPRKDKKI